MVQADIDKFRRRIGDKPKQHTDKFTVALDDTQFRLQFSNVMNEEVTVNGLPVTTGYAVDPIESVLIFDSPLPNGAEISITYEFVAYTNAELNALVDEVGFSQGVVEIISELLMDSARLYDYSEGATSARLSQVFEHLQAMLKFYKDEASAETTGFVSADGKKMGTIRMGKRTTAAYRVPARRKHGDVSRYDDL